MIKIKEEFKNKLEYKNGRVDYDERCLIYSDSGKIKRISTNEIFEELSEENCIDVSKSLLNDFIEA